MITRIISTVVFCGVVLALWQMAGGNNQDFFHLLWTIFYTAVSWVANLFTIAFQTVFVTT